jgi:hypothetical protein
MTHRWSDEYEDQITMNYDESKAGKAKKTAKKAPEPIKLANNDWHGVDHSLLAFFALVAVIGLGFFVFSKRYQPLPVPPAAITEPAKPETKPNPGWKEPGSARDTFNQNFGR